MAADVGVIWGEGEEEYFLIARLTAKSLICPAGTIKVPYHFFKISGHSARYAGQAVAEIVRDNPGINGIS
jgi:hypothetical protein